jgi:RNA polymerase sigma-70 factor, ECF subfamily
VEGAGRDVSIRDGPGSEERRGAHALLRRLPIAARRRPGERGPPLDAASRDWLVRLTGSGRERDDAIADLLALLAEAARFVLARRRGLVSNFPRETIDDLADEAAGEALIQVLEHLDDYRGASRFTTWAWKFAFYEALQAVRRRSWMGREIPVEDAAWWSTLAHTASPEELLEQRELLSALQNGIEHALTPHQRSVFVALAVNGVPVDVLADRLGTTRGALYKTLHEARRRLRRHLSA